MKRTLMHKLLNWAKSANRKPLIIKGARQVGKTYLLKEFGQSQYPQMHYINFEKTNLNHLFESDFDSKRIINELSFHLDMQINITTDIVIFDEIQACPRAITSLKYFCEDMPELNLCCAGSLLGVQLNEASFPVGKVDYLNMYPLTFSEFLLGNDEHLLYECLQQKEDIPTIAHQKLWDQLKLYFIVGGLPEVVQLYIDNKTEAYTALKLVRQKQKTLVNDYYADIAKHSGKVNAMHIDRVFTSVPAQLSQVHDGTSQRFRFKGIIPGIDRYNRLTNVIDWLENAGLISKAPLLETAQSPLSAYSKESFFKLFIFDIGLLGSMSGIAPKEILDYDYGTYKGYFAENFVAQALIANGYEDLFSWQEGRAEVEFLINIDGSIIPIEVKAGSITHAKSLAQFTKKYNPKYRVIYSAKEKYFDHNTQTAYIPLYLAGIKT